MGHMEVGLMVVTGRIGMTQLEMTTSWTLQIREVMDTGPILVMVLTRSMIVIVIILIGGVTRDIFWISSRNLNHLLLMDILIIWRMKRLGYLG